MSIDGLQPEKGPETLYVVREIGQNRVWFAVALLSSTEAEIKQVLMRAREMVEQLGLPVQCWVSDKQKAFVTGIAEVFKGVPHRYCENHCLRDLAKPMLAEDSNAKVQMRKKVRGLRKIEHKVEAEKAQLLRPQLRPKWLLLKRHLLRPKRLRLKLRRSPQPQFWPR